MYGRPSAEHAHGVVYMESKIARTERPTWVFSTSEFKEKLGLPADASIIFVGVQFLQETVTVMGSTKEEME